MEIRQYLQEIESSAIAGNDDLCVTLEDANDSNHWIQLMSDCFNASYLYDDDPARRLSLLELAIPEGWTLLSWEANTFVTLEMPLQAFDEVEDYVRRYFIKMFNRDIDKDAITVSAEDLE